MKKLFRFLLRSILLLILLVLLYGASAFILSGITIHKEATVNPTIAIYIKTNGVHTDIVVPVKNDYIDWSKEIKYSNTVAKDTTMQWLAMGWGDKGFYLQTPTWADLKMSTAFKAAFALSSTAIHATFYRSLPENQFCKKIMITPEQYVRLADYILNSLQQDSTGHAMYIAANANYNNNDAFYEATGHYSLFKTCNSWANTALKVSGQKCCLWTAFDTGIFLKYE